MVLKIKQDLKRTASVILGWMGMIARFRRWSVAEQGTGAQRSFAIWKLRKMYRQQELMSGKLESVKRLARPVIKLLEKWTD